jgi:hypothetical protein
MINELSSERPKRNKRREESRKRVNIHIDVTGILMGR